MSEQTIREEAERWLDFGGRVRDVRTVNLVRDLLAALAAADTQVQTLTAENQRLQERYDEMFAVTERGGARIIELERDLDPDQECYTKLKERTDKRIGDLEREVAELKKPQLASLSVALQQIAQEMRQEADIDPNKPYPAEGVNPYQVHKWADQLDALTARQEKKEA